MNALNQESCNAPNLPGNFINGIDRANSNLKQAVTDTAVAAANVQAAANAVLKLAGDIGAIHNTVSTGYNDDILNNAAAANKRLDDIAYHAENASQAAMDCSAYTAEITVNQLQRYTTEINTGTPGLQAQLLPVVKSTNTACNKGGKVVHLMQAVVYKLNGAVEIIRKLSAAVTQYKILNPASADDLACKISASEKDANNAIALTLVALKSSAMAYLSQQEVLISLTASNL